MQPGDRQAKRRQSRHGYLGRPEQDFRGEGARGRGTVAKVPLPRKILLPQKKGTSHVLQLRRAGDSVPDPEGQAAWGGDGAAGTFAEGGDP